MSVQVSLSITPTTEGLQGGGQREVTERFVCHGMDGKFATVASALKRWASITLLLASGGAHTSGRVAG